jgi:hypothetical protein
MSTPHQLILKESLRFLKEGGFIKLEPLRHKVGEDPEEKQNLDLYS